MFQIQVHERQGLMALVRGEPIYDAFTLKVLRRKGYIRPDGVAALDGRGAAAAAVHDEARWALYRRLYPEDAASTTHQGVAPIKDALPRDVVADLGRRLSLQKVSP